MRSVISLKKVLQKKRRKKKTAKHCQRCKERKSRSGPRAIHTAFLFSAAVILKGNKDDEASSSLNTQLNCDTEPLSFHYCPLFLQLHLYFHIFCKVKANQTRSNNMQSSGRYCVRSKRKRKKSHILAELSLKWCFVPRSVFFFFNLILYSCVLFSTAKPQSQNCTFWNGKPRALIQLLALNVTLSAPVKKRCPVLFFLSILDSQSSYNFSLLFFFVFFCTILIFSFPIEKISFAIILDAALCRLRLSCVADCTAL